MAQVKFIKGNITGPETTYVRSGIGNIEFDSNTKQILLDGQNYSLGRIYFQTCSTDAATGAKVATGETFPMDLEDSTKPQKGIVIAVKYTVSDTAKAAHTLKVNNASAAQVYYNNAVVTSTTAAQTVAFGTANRYVYYVWDGTYWVWLNHSTDLNTTYAIITKAEIDTGTATTARSVSAVILRENFYTETEVDNLLTGKQDTLTFDSIPIENSTNPVTSGGLYTVITDNERVTAASLNDLEDRKANSSDLATVATSGSYNDLTDKPTIPAAITESTVSSWGFTKNIGTLTATKTINTDHTDKQVVNSSETTSGSGTINLHKVAKTGTYSDLIGTPDLSKKADIASPTFTGTPKAPTANTGTNNTQIATTAFVQQELAAFDNEIFIAVSTLPTTDVKTNKIYIVPNSLTAPENNLYDEYIYKNNTWELIGTSQIDLNSKEDKWTIELYTGSNIFPTNPYNTIYVLNGKYYHCSLNTTAICEWRSLDGQNYINYNKANGKWNSGGIDNITAYDVNVTSKDEVRNIWESGDDLDSTLHNIVANINSLDSSKQKSLVSGTDIKTINSTSLLGSGNITVQPTLVSGTNIKTLNGQSLLGSGDIELDGDDIVYDGEGNGTYNPGVTSIDDCIDDLDARIITLSTPASGITANRPSTNLKIGQQYFDTTLGIPIWWNGTKWIDALGNTPENNNYVYTTT